MEVLDRNSIGQERKSELNDLPENCALNVDLTDDVVHLVAPPLTPLHSEDGQMDNLRNSKGLLSNWSERTIKMFTGNKSNSNVNPEDNGMTVPYSLKSQMHSFHQRKTHVGNNWRKVQMAAKVASATSGFSKTLESKATKAQMTSMEKATDQELHHELVHLFNLRRISFVEPDDDQVVEEKVQASLKDRWSSSVILPTSITLRLWNLVVGTVATFQVVYIPFIVSFAPVLKNTPWEVFDWIFDYIFVADMILHFNVAFYRRSGGGDPIDPREFSNRFYWSRKENDNRLVTSRLIIARNYLLGWFFMDLLATLPYDNTTESRISSSFKLIQLPRVAGLFRLLRVVKLLRVRGKFVHWIQYSSFSNLFRLTRLMLTIFCLVHVMCCAWYAVSRNGWGATRFEDEDGIWKRYSCSYYASLLMMMGEDIQPTTTKEVLYCSLSIIFGAVVIAVIFGNVAILVANFYADSSRYHHKMESVFISMKHLRLPSALQDRIQLYYSYLWQQYHTLDGNTSAFVSELSTNLRAEVDLFLNAKMIRNVPLMQECSPEVVHELVQQLTTQTYMPGDHIINQGEVGVEMYFVQRGECDVFERERTTLQGSSLVDDRKMIFKHKLQSGDYFGEVAVLMDARRLFSVRARTFCTLCVLQRQNFQNVIARYKEDRSILEQIILQKYVQNQSDTEKISLIKRNSVKSMLRLPTEPSPASNDIQELQKSISTILTKLNTIEAAMPPNPPPTS